MQNNEDKKKQRLSIGDAADYLGVSIDTLRRWEKKGKIEALRSPGGHRYFNKSDLDILFGTKYERVEDERKEEKSPEETKFEEVSTIKKIETQQPSTPFQTATPPYDMPAPPPVSYSSTVSIQPNIEQNSPVQIIEKPTPPTKQTINQQSQTSNVNSNQKHHLTTQQEEKLSEIIKNNNKKKFYSKFVKILFIGLIIFGVIDIIIAYVWFTQSTIVSPVP